MSCLSVGNSGATADMSLRASSLSPELIPLSFMPRPSTATFTALVALSTLSGSSSSYASAVGELTNDAYTPGPGSTNLAMSSVVLTTLMLVYCPLSAATLSCALSSSFTTSPTVDVVPSTATTVASGYASTAHLASASPDPAAVRISVQNASASSLPVTFSRFSHSITIRAGITPGILHAASPLTVTTLSCTTSSREGRCITSSMRSICCSSTGSATAPFSAILGTSVDPRDSLTMLCSKAVEGSSSFWVYPEDTHAGSQSEGRSVRAAGTSEPGLRTKAGIP